jgi:hypothetical protein
MVFTIPQHSARLSGPKITGIPVPDCGQFDLGQCHQWPGRADLPELPDKSKTSGEYLLTNYFCSLWPAQDPTRIGTPQDLFLW